MLELVCTSYDGNVTDAAFLAASSALKCTSYPVMHYQTGVEESCNGHRFLAKSLSKGPEFMYFPISISFVRIKGGSEFVCDPSSSNVEDETVSSLVYGTAIPLGTTALSTATISVEVAVSVNDESKDVLDGTVLHVALSGYPSIEQKELESACNEAKKQAQSVSKLL
jgi:exosome complex RNA-binding protein Rrp42 (RNase PH superfamily)